MRQEDELSAAEPGGRSDAVWRARDRRAWRISRWGVLVLLIGLAGIAVAQRTSARSLLVELRDAFLVHHVTDPAKLYDAPDALRRSGFREDDPATRERWMKRVAGLPTWGDALERVRRIDGDVGRGRALALALGATAGRGPGSCGGVGDLEQLLRFIADGGLVCCSDYTAAFLSLAPSLGIVAREIRVAVPHGVVEVYDAQRGAWVLIDPLFGMLARNARGEALSTWELQEALSSGRGVRFEFFGRALDASPSDRNRTAFDSIYGARFATAELSTPMGNDVLRYDEFRRPVAFLPKVMVQAAALSTGILPDILALAPMDVRKVRMRTALRRSAVLLACATLGAMLLCGPAVSIGRRLMATGASQRMDGSLPAAEGA